MKYFKIPEVKEFMNMLLTKETFDDFLLVSATAQGKGSLSLEGRLPEENGYYRLPYGNFRGVLFAFIKGKELPKSVKVILELSNENAQRLFPGQFQDGDSASITIYFREDGLFVVAGFASETFSMDRSKEHDWERYIEGYLKDLGFAPELL